MPVPKATGLAALLTGACMIAEVIGGLWSDSLALLAHAGHMLTDFAALSMAWLAFRIGRRLADRTRACGFDRLSVLSGFASGLALFAVAIWIVVEAFHRLEAPEPVARGDRSNLNLRASLLHVAGDLLGSTGAIAAALIIIRNGWTPIDPILSVLVALLILVAACRVVRDSAHILLEGTPPDSDAAISEAVGAAITGIADVRHLHAWSITEDRPMITLEAVIAQDACTHSTRRRVISPLAKDFGFDHTTVEIVTGDATGPAGPLPVRAPAPS